jgi:hypothetical protein
MRRLPTNLTKLDDLEKRLADEAAQLTKRRNALAKQRDRLEQKAQRARWEAVGKLLEHLGLPVDDLDALKRTLLPLQNTDGGVSPKQPMSNT